MKSIYTYYKERLIEISGKNRSIYTRSFSKKTGYDLGRLLARDTNREDAFVRFLWSDGREPFDLFSSGDKTLRKIFDSDAEEKRARRELETQGLTGDEKDRAVLRLERQARQAFNANVAKEVTAVRTLKREAEDIEKETGRYELFVGYPFVYGGTRDFLFKAPLLFFPVEVDAEEDTKVTLRLKRGESVRLNKALLFAYAQSRRIDTTELVTEFDDLRAAGLTDLDRVLDYLDKFGLHIRRPEHKHMREFGAFREPTAKDPPAIARACVLARYSLANSIYNDYSEIEKRHITSEAADELIAPNARRRKRRREEPDRDLFMISDLDYAQRSVVAKVARQGNMVIYGPPGTGKSQTIVNLISDAICKGKRVLVVSQKKAALDVVYNRLGDLNKKAMFVVDPVKERRAFYDRCLTRHNAVIDAETPDSYGKYRVISDRLDAEIAKLEAISDSLLVKSPFGLSLIEMYYNSFIPGKRSGEYSIYREMIRNKRLLSYDYETLNDALTSLRNGKADIYYDYAETRKRNPFIQYLRPDLHIDTLSRARAKLAALMRTRVAVFDENSHPYSRQILALYDKLGSEKGEKLLVKTLAAYEYPKTYSFLQTSKIAFPLYPVARLLMSRKEKETERKYIESKQAIEEFASDYEFLKEVLTYDGYALAVEAVLRGDQAALGDLAKALAEYVRLGDMVLSLSNFSEPEKTVLAFAYRITDSREGYKRVLEKLMPIRIYREITEFEDSMKADLSRSVEFESIKSAITALMGEQREICKELFEQSFVAEYQRLYQKSADCKDFLYQISKKQNFWPIRRTMEVFGEYLLDLFPCWLLSPENVSSILPLKKELFDLVLFDEASQVFIECTLPAIIRGRNIVVAGDAKQLRPTATFLRRYMGGGEEEDDLTRQAALEVESLLDLAVARYDSANITYHYRSASRELIDFSNMAFYDGKLRIAPNVSRSMRNKPIERIKVDGAWVDRSNPVEAHEIVMLLKKLFRSRRNRETMGIITFGSEQQACIENAIDRECKMDAAFRTEITRESSRKEDGQDVGLFVKNIENVQGDERDIIIFSIGYARGENGRVNAHFGSLSAEGGENRLNVAVTRAKRKIYVVTSIEPEELKVDGSKNAGPRLFRQYLAYVRAVSSGKKQEVKAILDALCPSPAPAISTLDVPPEYQIADKLEKLGYNVETDIGDGKNRISVAVYDKKTDRYVLGIQLDRALFEGKETALERDVFASRFLEQKGWKLMRVWSRDWWHNASDVMDNILKNLQPPDKAQ